MAVIWNTPSSIQPISPPSVIIPGLSSVDDGLFTDDGFLSQGTPSFPFEQPPTGSLRKSDDDSLFEVDDHTQISPLSQPPAPATTNQEPPSRFYDRSTSIPVDTPDTTDFSDTLAAFSPASLPPESFESFWYFSVKNLYLGNCCKNAGSLLSLLTAGLYLNTRKITPTYGTICHITL